jgi:hypothetical protein
VAEWWGSAGLLCFRPAKPPIPADVPPPVVVPPLPVVPPPVVPPPLVVPPLPVEPAVVPPMTEPPLPEDVAPEGLGEAEELAAAEGLGRGSWGQRKSGSLIP